jgi:hypothetical protein
MLEMGDPCESLLYSFFISVDGEGFPCSFSPGTPGWETGLKITEETDFVKDIWNHPRSKNWRENLMDNGRECPLFEI